MNILHRQHNLLLKETSLKHIRDIYHEIDWNERLIGIKGARGVGKTTLMLQRILTAFSDLNIALYVSMDNLWFGNHNLIDLAEHCLQEGITHLFLDEIHQLEGWERQIKYLHDTYIGLNVVFTGSSTLEIDNSVADLSRRVRIYEMRGLSFREYLNFSGHNFNRVTLSDILYENQEIVNNIKNEINPTAKFHNYLKCGYYPFFLTHTTNSYLVRVAGILDSVIFRDLPAVEAVEYSTLVKAKKLLSIMSTESPSPLNAKRTAEALDVGHTQLLKIFDLLERSQVLRLLYYKTPESSNALRKPQKILFDNSSLLYALGNENLGKVRETFVASMVGAKHKLGYPKNGDLLVDNRYLFEIGGRKKSYEQIAGVPDSFLVLDDLEFPFGSKLPIWLFGFLY